MKTVGLRELKARLSHYIRQVRTGRHVLVTDRGEIVAELAPPGASTDATARVPQALAVLARKGLVRLAVDERRAPYEEMPRVLRRRTSAELLDAERSSA